VSTETKCARFVVINGLLKSYRVGVKEGENHTYEIKWKIYLKTFPSIGFPANDTVIFFKRFQIT
jgi:hypothetical protein